eukprot:PRCOL_00000083-RA
MAELRALNALLERHDIELQTEYIRSESNVDADRLSREDDEPTWRLARTDGDEHEHGHEYGEYEHAHGYGGGDSCNSGGVVWHSEDSSGGEAPLELRSGGEGAELIVRGNLTVAGVDVGQALSAMRGRLAALEGSCRSYSPPPPGEREHPPTYTLGTGSTLEHVRFDPSAPPHGAAVYRVERGGEVTYHGPGQLVLYPVLDLRRYERDLHWYMRQLEEVVIRALRDGAGIADARRVDGLTGVWVGDAKVAACGVRVRRWVAFHGVALNVAPDMRHFEDIVPCGIGDRPVCSVEGVLAARGAAAGGASPTEGDALRDALADALLRAFEEVFGAELVGADAAAAAAFDGADAEGAAREGAVAARGARASAGGG